MRVVVNLLNVILKGSSHWYEFINTNAPLSAFTFYKQADFTPLSDIDNVTHRLYLKKHIELILSFAGRNV